MATLLEVSEVIDQLTVLNLRPVPENKAATAKAYAPLLADIPGQTLRQAANDHAMNSGFFPSVSELRQAAAKVKSHNNTSAAANPFKPLDEQKIIWYIPEHLKQGSPYPEDVRAEIAEIESRTGFGPLSEEDSARLDAITEPWLEKALPRIAQ